MEFLLDSIRTSRNKLVGYKEPKAMKNDASRFLIVGPNKASNQIDWESFYSQFLMTYLQKNFKFSSFNSWKDEFIKELSSERKYKDIIKVLEDVYLSEDVIKKITPLGFALPTSEDKISGKTLTLLNQFKSMLDFDCIPNDYASSLNNNFLEEIILSSLGSSFVKTNAKKVSKPYLPYLATHFTNDLNFLFKHQKFFMKEYKSFLNLYNFLYITQLSINLERSPLETPRSQKLYFILDTEKASKERTELNAFGYYSLFEEKGACWKLFPYLTYLHLISNKYESDDLPTLWELVDLYPDEQQAITELALMNDSLGNLFDSTLDRGQSSCNLAEELSFGLKLQYSTFLKGNSKSTRFGANDKVQKSIKEYFGGDFIKLRGAAGTFLELKADIVLLLTNLIIGDSKFKLIDEIIEGMQNRGVWLDVQSRSALVEFYESIGNAEKLSDSGDAVYVKSTF